MRAMMSDREARADVNVFDSLPRAEWMTVESGWQAPDLWAFNAELEARRILGETEPYDPMGPNGRRVVCGLYTLSLDGRKGSTSQSYANAQGVTAALIEALKGFLGVTQ